jgi:hypothetical protein
MQRQNMSHRLGATGKLGKSHQRAGQAGPSADLTGQRIIEQAGLSHTSQRR